MRVLTVTKSRTSGKDVLTDRFGRYFHLPVELSAQGGEGLTLLVDYERGNVRDATYGSCTFRTIPPVTAGVSASLGRIDTLVRSFRPDVVIGGGDTQLGWVGRRLARRLDVPFVFDVFDNYESFASARIPGMRRLFHALANSADLTVVVSTPLVDLLAGASRIAVVPNGVDLELFRPQSISRVRFPNEKPLVVYVGGMGEGRGTTTLVQAVGLLRQTIPGASLQLVGRPQAGYEIPRREWVEHVGFVEQENVPQLIGAADVAVLPYHETAWARYTSPYKLIEYMACGVPVVVTDVSTFSSEVEAPEQVARPDDPTDLARAIKFQLHHRLIAQRDHSWSWAARAEKLMIQIVAAVR